MKAFLVLAFVVAAYAAPEPPSGYSSGGYSDGGNFGSFPGLTGGNNNFVGNLQSSGGQVHRHVYVHVAPDDPADESARVIRIPSKNDKHVNIIFVKTPSSSSAANTEVILPEQDEQKNIVYVLVKKFDATTDLKIRAPRPTTPSKPEVYFIRYKNQDNGSQNGGAPGGGPSGSYGPPPSAPRPQYGAPF